MLIGYARVSTDEQNLDLQLNALKRAGCDRIYQDSGVSGAVARRPGLDQALAALEPGDTLIVWRLDRLGRSLVNLIQAIQDLDRRSVHFRSLTETIDTGSSGGRLVFHLMGAMAEFERALISERTRAGMKVAKTRGQPIGRPPLLSEKQRADIRKGLARGAAISSLAKRYSVSTTTIARVRREEDIEMPGQARPSRMKIKSTGR
jgi:DNA invertase Pin-like site-specific DNA recombinase